MNQLNYEDQNRLELLYSTMILKKNNYLGYPNNTDLHDTNLAKFLEFTINNVGDPFLGNNGMNTFSFEQEVLKYFQNLLHIPTEESWGYVTNGGTESNLFGLYVGREYFPDGIVYYSRESHYSVSKAARLLNLRSVVLRTEKNGEIDYLHFSEMIETLKQYPAIINLNIGTTMKGAIDQAEKVIQILQEKKVKYYIHCDAALFGAMLPYLENAPLFDFKLPIQSIAISGHKFLGSTIPSGIVLVRKEFVEKIKNSIEYIGSFDSTLSGSRDGFSVLLLWQRIKKYKTRMKEVVQTCMDYTEYTLNELRKIDWPSWANPFSNIVIIRRPSQELVSKWQLASEGDISHLVLMPGVTKEKIDRFVCELTLLLKENK